MAAGADGCRGGLLVVSDAEDGGTRLTLVDDLRALLHGGSPGLLLLDVPIGLPEQGARACDLAARRLLGPRRSSVFPAPLRPMLAAGSFAEACAIRRSIEGKGYSAQAYGVLPLVRAVDELLSPERQQVVREGHPEVSFAALAGAPLVHSKHVPAGRALRRALLADVFPDLDENLARLGRPGLLADALDAYALLWSARRLEGGAAVSLPGPPELDARGLRMEIVY